MKNIFITFFVTLALSIAGVAYASSLPVGGQTYYLAGAGVTATQTTVQLTSLATADGTKLTMSNFGTEGYGTLEPQSSAKVEFVHFTGITQNTNGTATLTGVTRGVGYVYPYTPALSLEHSHAGGATFIISNTPEFYYNEFSMQNNNNVFTYPSASTSPATKGYVDQVAFSGSGAIAASTANRGYVQIATPLQLASSTGIGSTGAVVVASADNATSTWNAATSPLKLIVTQNNGQIDPNFLASSTSSIGKNIQVFSPGTSTFAVPAGVKKVLVTLQGAGAPGGSCFGSGIASGGAGAGGYSFGVFDVSATTSIQVFVGATTTSTTTQAAWSTFGTNGFYASAQGGNPGASAVGGPTTGQGGVGGSATGGSLNITGQRGTDGYLAIVNTTGPVYAYINGYGGDSPLGFGSTDTATPPAGATGYGAGGAGAICGTGGSFYRIGGSGTNGFEMIQY